MWKGSQLVILIAIMVFRGSAEKGIAQKYGKRVNVSSSLCRISLPLLHEEIRRSGLCVLLRHGFLSVQFSMVS